MSTISDNMPNSVGVKPQVRDAGDLQPAFVTTNRDNGQFGGLAIFANPVQGNVDTTTTHEGDLGGAAPGM